jgi:peptidoglycan biosynthesis protein MviN/MurJ (putative lipid II flippase)
MFHFMIFIGIIIMYINVIKLGTSEFYQKVNLLLFVAKILMFIAGVVFNLLTLSILFRKGTNQELKKLAVRRQFMFLFIFLFFHSLFAIYFYDSSILQYVNLKKEHI